MAKLTEIEVEITHLMSSMGIEFETCLCSLTFLEQDDINDQKLLEFLLNHPNATDMDVVEEVDRILGIKGKKGSKVKIAI